MDKLAYSEDFNWYDDSVFNAILDLADKHENAIPVFSGALSAYNCINATTPDFATFVDYLKEVAHNAIFYSWYEGALGALRRFCRLCHVDPMLVELYLGAPLERLVG